ncbi:hypothetical protein [Parabacteroides pacaensis]|uniref:hypothetical protein n=1 Tax=Parabacteroides pacaensis TaxID=2086575 RepID=UPI000D0F19ED|nr:hypothetical protein [Parabacteroides pacaensis]
MKIKSGALIGGIALFAAMSLNLYHIADNYGFNSIKSFHQLVLAQSSLGGGTSSGVNSSTGGNNSTGKDIQAEEKVTSEQDKEKSRCCLGNGYDDVVSDRLTTIICKGIGTTSCTPFRYNKHSSQNEKMFSLMKERIVF